MNPPLRVVVCGVGGRMGGRVLAAARAERDLAVVGATERRDSPLVGKDAGVAAGGVALGVAISSSLETAIAAGADAVIDFTAPSASLVHAAVCEERGVALVLGTTGFSAQERKVIEGHAKKVPLLHAPNMSVGVNVLFALVEEAARALGRDYECEIVELHHRAKRDAPSGTAVRLGEVAARALGLDVEASHVYSRQGDVGPRRPGTIGLQTLRGGDVVGDHTVLFLADGERLELTHRATSRDNFARGALRAVRFLRGKAPGLYQMSDVLGF